MFRALLRATSRRRRRVPRAMRVRQFRVGRSESRLKRREAFRVVSRAEKTREKRGGRSLRRRRDDGFGRGVFRVRRKRDERRGELGREVSIAFALGGGADVDPRFGVCRFGVCRFGVCRFGVRRFRFAGIRPRLRIRLAQRVRRLLRRRRGDASRRLLELQRRASPRRVLLGGVGASLRLRHRLFGAPTI